VIGIVEVVQGRPGEERDEGRGGGRHVDATRGSSMEVKVRRGPGVEDGERGLDEEGFQHGSSPVKNV
jgi:hypothetical protein